MTQRQQNFLKQLASLCKQYKASFGYTTADDGIHIEVDGEADVFVGWLMDPPAELAHLLVRSAVNKPTPHKQKKGRG